MKFIKLGFVLSAFAAFLLACSQTPTTSNTPVVTNTQVAANANTSTPPPNDEFAATKEIYGKKCASCHGDNGEGGQKDFDGDKFKVPSYKSPSAMKAEDKDFIDVISNGQEKMPAYKTKLKPEEIASLVKFIHKEFQGK